MEAQIASGAVPEAALKRTHTLIFNSYLNVGVTSLLVGLILCLIFEAVSVWIRLLSGSKDVALNEAPYVPTRWPMEGRV